MCVCVCVRAYIPYGTDPHVRRTRVKHRRLHVCVCVCVSAPIYRTVRAPRETSTERGAVSRVLKQPPKRRRRIRRTEGALGALQYWATEKCACPTELSGWRGQPRGRPRRRQLRWRRRFSRRWRPRDAGFVFPRGGGRGRPARGGHSLSGRSDVTANGGLGSKAKQELRSPHERADDVRRSVGAPRPHAPPEPLLL